MKVGDSEKKPELINEALQEQRRQTRKLADELAKQSVGTDSVDLNISNAAQLLTQSTELESVETRAKRVADLKASIAAGTYLKSVDVRDVAKKLIEEFSSIGASRVDQNANEES